MTDSDCKDDAATAAVVEEWFGKYIADRPMQFFALMGLAKVAVLAMGGNTNARQMILDGTIDSTLGVSVLQAESIAKDMLHIFFSAAAGDDPDPETYQTDAIAWAQRWERARYGQ